MTTKRKKKKITNRRKKEMTRNYKQNERTIKEIEK
jgi:hypothetical protein